jgi:hypothetical protein
MIFGIIIMDIKCEGENMNPLKKINRALEIFVWKKTRN